MSKTPHEQIEQCRILVFCGSGGVGKTTIAAATALWGAIHGRRVLVMTIDPAKRLANAMGLKELTEKETPVQLQQAFPGITGSLDAMMLDTKKVMDELLRDFAPHPEAAEKILNQKLYQVMSDSLIGAQEVVALGKLYDVYFRKNYDLIVVDTAPTKHAIDFLEMPAKLINLFDAEIINFFLRPMEKISSLGFKIFKKPTQILTDMIENAFGISILSEVSTFLGSFKDFAQGFKERSEKVLKVLEDPEQTTFALVTSPQWLAIENALYIAGKLDQLKLNLGFVIENRVTEKPGVADVDKAMAGLEEERVRQGLKELGLDYETLKLVNESVSAMAAHDRARLEDFHQRLPQKGSVGMASVPFFENEICDLAGLQNMGHAVYAQAKNPAVEG